MTQSARRSAAWVWGALVAFAIVLLALSAAAYQPPPIQGPVTDTAGKLTPTERAEIDQKLASLKASRGNEITVFVVGSLEGESIEDVAYTTFNTWTLGSKAADNGVLLVIAPNERKIRIETG